MDQMTRLRDRWAATWARADVAEPDPSSEASIFPALMAAYSERHRFYRTPFHLLECFDALDGTDERPCVEMEFALWFHDVVFDPLAADGINEDDSGVWAFKALKAISINARREVRRLIDLTVHEGRPSLATDRAGALLVDVDLSILGAPRVRFEEYELQIRKEYGPVSNALFREGRARLFEMLLARESVYQTPALLSQREASAQVNLRRSLRSLR